MTYLATKFIEFLLYFLDANQVRECDLCFAGVAWKIVVLSGAGV